MKKFSVRPAGEHGRRQQGRVGAVVGGEDGGLVAALGELAELPHPQPVAQAGAALGQPHVDRLTVGERDPPGLELVLGPGRAGVFVVAQAGHPLGLHPSHQVRAVALAVEHQRETVPEGVVGQRLRIRLAGHVLQQARQDVLFENLDQARVGRHVDGEERLAVHRVDPVVHRRPQAQLLPRHVMAGELGLVAVVDPHMAVDVEDAGLFRGRRHPLAAQFGAPFHRLAALGEQADLLPQGAHLRRPVQPEQLAPLAGGAMAQGFEGVQPRQRHERQQQEQGVQPVVALGQGEKAFRRVQQADRQQGGQRAQHTAVWHVQRRLEVRRDGGKRTQAGRRPRLDRARAHPHRRRAVLGAARTLGAPDDSQVFFFNGLCNRPARTALDSVSGLSSSRLATSAVSSPSSSNACALGQPPPSAPPHHGACAACKTPSAPPRGSASPPV